MYGTSGTLNYCSYNISIFMVLTRCDKPKICVFLNLQKRVYLLCFTVSALLYLHKSTHETQEIQTFHTGFTHEIFCTALCPFFQGFGPD